jgi:hypothetical protein
MIDGYARPFELLFSEVVEVVHTRRDRAAVINGMPRIQAALNIGEKQQWRLGCRP